MFFSILFFQDYGGTSDDKRASGNQANLTMIRRFNHHSLMVLKACEKAKPSSTDNSEGAGTHQQNGSNGSTPVNGESSQIPNGHKVDESPPKKVLQYNLLCAFYLKAK